MRQCDVGVTREGGGTATVLVTKPDGAKRAICFTNAEATGAAASQADGATAFSASREGDRTTIRIGDERDETPMR